MRSKLLNKIMIPLVFMISLLLVNAEHGFTQVEEKEKKVYKLDKVIVRDHPLKEAITVTPQVTVINVDKFKKAGTVQTIRDVLSEIGGLDVLSSSVTPSQSDSIYIRGMDQSRIQIFVDGKPMRLTGTRGYYKIDWTTMLLDNVETIEVIKGSHSLLYPYAMGGAINIITKKGIKTDELKPRVTAKTEFGTYGMEGYSASVTGGLLNTIGYSMSAATRTGDGYLRNNWYDSDNLNGRITFYLPADGKLLFGYDHVNYVSGYPVINDPSRDDFDPDYPAVKENEVDTFTHDREGRCYPGGISYWEKRTRDANMLYEQPLGPGELRFQLHEKKEDRARCGYSYSKGKLKQGTVSDNEYYVWGTSLDYQNFELVKDHTLSIGGEYRDLGTPDNKNYSTTLSGYLQDVWSVTPYLNLTYGFRYYRFEIDAARPYKTSADRVNYRRIEKAFCPKIRADYQLNPGLALYAAVSSETRTP